MKDLKRRIIKKADKKYPNNFHNWDILRNLRLFSKIVVSIITY